MTSTIGLMGGGISGTTLTTTFTARDDDIIAVDETYTDLEEEIWQEINDIETDYPGYDEYYTLNERITVTGIGDSFGSYY